MQLETYKTTLNLLVWFFYLLSFEIHLYEGTDIISVGQTLSGNRTISSEDGTFELGFFTPGKSQNYYIGIWYKKFDTKLVVWVANRNHPVSDPNSSELKLLPNGNLALLNESRLQIWSSNATTTTDNSSLAILLDDGNFVTRDNQDSSNVIWQSFDYPTYSWLPPGGNAGFNKIKKEKIYLSPWKNEEDPAPGLFSLEVEIHVTNYFYFYDNIRQYWPNGAWTGTSLDVTSLEVFAWRGAIPEDKSFITIFNYISVLNESVFTHDIDIPKTLTRLMIDVTGQYRQLVWRENLAKHKWLPYWLWPEQCVYGNLSDYFGDCIQLEVPNLSDYCGSLQGYKLRWSTEDFTDWCMMISEEGIKEVREYFKKKKEHKDSKTRIWIIVGSIGGFFILLGIVIFIFLQLGKRKVGRYNGAGGNLMLFKYKEIRKSTKNFSEKLGEGGFGSVFKGTLPISRAIAVKRLKNLKQGEKQFRAEVSTIGQIQHVNLVRLQGFCIEGEKRLLVFDYMKNGSLENHLFREKSNVLLDWKARHKIMIGTARGLNYLHEKCRDCIIHCDIKPENILLDDEFNAKIADFGLAKILGREFSHVLTTIKGTRGYLAPEWILNETITAKVDVYSYGKLLFEIISGRRNMELLDDGDYFPALVAEKLSEGEEVLTQFLDKRLKGEANLCELARACKVACWCIQDDEKDRPNMGTVIQILEGLLEVGIPPIPRMLLAFTKKDISQSITLENSTFCTTSSMSSR